MKVRKISRAVARQVVQKCNRLHRPPKKIDVRVLLERLHQLIDIVYFFSAGGTPTSSYRGISLSKNNPRVIEMKNVLKKLLALDFYSGSPLKYRESAYTIYELEKRLIAEINGYRQKSTF